MKDITDVAKERTVDPEDGEESGAKKVSIKEKGKNVGKSALGYVGSFVATAVPSTLISTVVGGAYSLFSGIGAAIGLSGVAKAAGGVLGTLVVTGPVAILSFALGAGSLLGLAAAAEKIPVIKNLDEKPKALLAGALAGPFIAYSLVFAGATGDGVVPPEKTSALPSVEQIVPSTQKDPNTFSAMGQTFKIVSNDNLQKPAAQETSIMDTPKIAMGMNI